MQTISSGPTLIAPSAKALWSSNAARAGRRSLPVNDGRVVQLRHSRVARDELHALTADMPQERLGTEVCSNAHHRIKECPSPATLSSRGVHSHGLHPDATAEADSGAAALVQRFGSAANLNIHQHCLVLNGVYRVGGDGVPAFVEVAVPTDDELHASLQTLITRLTKLLTRRGVLVEDMGQTYLAEHDVYGDEARTLRPLQAAAVTYRIAFGPRAEQKVLTLRGTMPGEGLWIHRHCLPGSPTHRRGIAWRHHSAELSRDGPGSFQACPVWPAHCV